MCLLFSMMSFVFRNEARRISISTIKHKIVITPILHPDAIVQTWSAWKHLPSHHHVQRLYGAYDIYSLGSER